MRAIILLALALFATAPAWAEMLHFKARLDTASEVPQKTGPGHGTVDATLDTATSRLTYTITYADLSGPLTGAHFHGPAGPTEKADVAIKIGGNLASPIHGEATLTHEQVEALTHGRWYVNLHTAANPGGEVRGQVMK